MTSAVNLKLNDDLEENSESDEKPRKKKHVKPKNFKCLSCEKSYSSRLDRNTHNLRVHKKPSDQICHVCGMKFHVIYDLTKHLSRVHGDAKNAKKILEPCDFCGKTFSSMFFSNFWFQDYYSLLCIFRMPFERPYRDSSRKTTEL